MKVGLITLIQKSGKKCCPLTFFQQIPHTPRVPHAPYAYFLIATPLTTIIADHFRNKLPLSFNRIIANMNAWDRAAIRFDQSVPVREEK